MFIWIFAFQHCVTAGYQVWRLWWAFTRHWHGTGHPDGQSFGLANLRYMKPNIKAQILEITCKIPIKYQLVFVHQKDQMVSSRLKNADTCVIDAIGFTEQLTHIASMGLLDLGFDILWFHCHLKSEDGKPQLSLFKMGGVLFEQIPRFRECNDKEKHVWKDCNNFLACLVSLNSPLSSAAVRITVDVPGKYVGYNMIQWY